MTGRKRIKMEKYYKVTLEIEAPNKEYIERMLDGMPHADRIYDESIRGEEDRELVCRIRYEEDFCGRGEYFVFETKWSDEDGWGLDTAFPIREGRIHYTALTKIRELQSLGVRFYFGSTDD